MFIPLCSAPDDAVRGVWPPPFPDSPVRLGRGLLILAPPWMFQTGALKMILDGGAFFLFFRTPLLAPLSSLLPFSLGSPRSLSLLYPLFAVLPCLFMALLLFPLSSTLWSLLGSCVRFLLPSRCWLRCPSLCACCFFSFSPTLSLLLCYMLPRSLHALQSLMTPSYALCHVLEHATKVLFPMYAPLLRSSWAPAILPLFPMACCFRCVGAQPQT